MFLFCNFDFISRNCTFISYNSQNVLVCIYTILIFQSELGDVSSRFWGKISNLAITSIIFFFSGGNRFPYIRFLKPLNIFSLSLSSTQPKHISFIQKWYVCVVTKHYKQFFKSWMARSFTFQYKNLLQKSFHIVNTAHKLYGYLIVFNVFCSLRAWQECSKIKSNIQIQNVMRAKKINKNKRLSFKHKNAVRKYFQYRTLVP